MQDNPHEAYRPIKRPDIQAHLQELYPHLFTIPVPLKVGIGKDLLARHDRLYSQKTLSVFMHHWTHQDAYCDAVERGKHRYDLAGNICPMETNQSRRGDQ